MNKKGCSAVDVIIVIIGILTFILIQMQFNWFAKEVNKNAETNDYIKSVFWKQADGLKEVRKILNLEPIKEHGHVYHDGSVRR